jgi:hypothetical protein
MQEGFGRGRDSKLLTAITSCNGIDTYYANYVEAEGLRDAAMIQHPGRWAEPNTSTSVPRCTTASSAPWRRAAAGGEMLRIQNRHVDWERHQIAIPGRHAKDAENRRIPFDPQGRLAPVLKRRARLPAQTRTCSDHQLASSWPTSRRPGSRCS